MTDINLSERAWKGKLTVEDVKDATKEKLEEKDEPGNTVLYRASYRCGIEVVEAILDKNVNIDEFSTNVSNKQCCGTYYFIVVIKLTLSLIIEF
jgi:hypothetical protein